MRAGLPRQRRSRHAPADRSRRRAARNRPHGRPRARRWASHASPGCDAAGGRLPAGGPGAAPVAQRRDGRSGGARTRRAHRRRARHRHARAVHAARRQAVLLRGVGHELRRLPRGRRRGARLRAIRSGTRPRSRRSWPASPASPSGAGWTLGVLGASTQRLAALARRRIARPLHGRRSRRRSGSLLARGARDPQGAPVGDPARARGLQRRGRARQRDRRAARGAHRRDLLALARRPRRDRVHDGVRRRRRRPRARRPLRHRPRFGRRASRLPALRRRSRGRRALALDHAAGARHPERTQRVPDLPRDRPRTRAPDPARVAQLRRVRPAARPAGAARSALPRGARACSRASSGASSSSACSRSARSSRRSGRRATRPIPAWRRSPASHSQRCSPRPTSRCRRRPGGAR